MLDTIYTQIGKRFLELAITAEFAAPKTSNGAVKAKKCTTGLSCGGACISKTKICKRALDIDRQKQFKELKKRLAGGVSVGGGTLAAQLEAAEKRSETSGNRDEVLRIKRLMKAAK